MEETQTPSPEPPPSQKTPKKNPIGLVAIIILITTKGAKLFKPLKILFALKYAKTLITVISMAFSTLLYSITLGPWFAIGFVLMLFIHEMGHVLALKIRGYETSAPIFIPFLGALIFAPKFKSEEDEAFIGYGGPLIGTLGALALFIILLLGNPTENPIALSVSYTAGLINLFNLIPVSPLDGGRVTSIVSKWFKWLGIAMFVAFIIFIREPDTLLLLIFICMELPINGKLRFGLTATIAVTMTTLLLFGYSNHHWIANLFYILVSLLWVAAAYLMRDAQLTQEKNLSHIATSAKIKWFTLYIGLIGAIILLMYWQQPYVAQLSHIK